MYTPPHPHVWSLPGHSYCHTSNYFDVMAGWTTQHQVSNTQDKLWMDQYLDHGCEWSVTSFNSFPSFSAKLSSSESSLQYQWTPVYMYMYSMPINAHTQHTHDTVVCRLAPSIHLWEIFWITTEQVYSFYKTREILYPVSMKNRIVNTWQCVALVTVHYNMLTLITQSAHTDHTLFFGSFMGKCFTGKTLSTDTVCA